MKTAVTYVGHLKHHEIWGSAFAAGLRKHGWTAKVSTNWEPCDLLVQWGVRNHFSIDNQKSQGGEVCILERGYLGDRFNWTSVSFGGGLNGRGEFRGPFQDGSRWEKYFAHLMKPWQPNPNGHALILGQVPGDMSIQGIDIDSWYVSAANAYIAAGYETRFRYHPDVERVVPLAADLEGAAVAVSWNSNSGVEAALNGFPVVAQDVGSMAYAIAGHKLGGVPDTPDRTAWAHRLAWCQYTMEEMQNGFCQEAIGLN